jgi:predicted acetyltransferase
MTGLEIRAVPFSEKPELWAMYQRYAYELAPLVNVEPVGGVFTDPRFDNYWREPNHWPFWALVDGQRVGFALIRFVTEEQTMRVAEFYVTPEHRRARIGVALAGHLLAQHPGPWRIRQIAANTPAVAFWRRVAEPYGYSETSFVDRGIDRVEQFLIVT